METILTLLIGLAVGALLGLLAAKGRQHALQTRIEVLQTETGHVRQQAEQAQADAQRRLKEAREEWEHTLQALLDAKQRACDEALAAQEQRHREATQALQTRFDETMRRVSAQVQTATDSLLKQRQQEFAAASRDGLGQIVNPLRETIEHMKQALEDNTLRQTSMSSEMRTHLEHLMQQSRAAQHSAEELARVFRRGSKVQGDWGETVLDELLEAQGLTRGIHYDTQATLRDASGQTLRSAEGGLMRPDVILHLDQRREVIIDSKVSLTAYMDYVNADTDEQRQQALKAHIASLQAHVKELAAKDYSAYIRPPKLKMDYVIMFVPHAGALWTALNAQPDLWRRAMDRNVFIADEQTLFAALRIIQLTWTQIAQAQNHEKVYALANEMLDRVGQFMKKYQALGKALEGAARAYEEGERKLQPTGQSILQTCAKLKRLGAKTSDKNPLPQLAETDGEEAEAPAAAEPEKETAPSPGISLPYSS